MIRVYSLYKCVKIYRLLPSFASNRLGQFLVKSFRANISLSPFSRIELLFEKKVVCCSDLVFQVELEVPLGLSFFIVMPQHFLENFFIDWNLLESHINAVTAYLLELYEPRMLYYLLEA